MRVAEFLRHEDQPGDSQSDLDEIHKKRQASVDPRLPLLYHHYVDDDDEEDVSSQGTESPCEDERQSMRKTPPHQQELLQQGSFHHGVMMCVLSLHRTRGDDDSENLRFFLNFSWNLHHFS